MKSQNDWSKEYSQDGELPGPSLPQRIGTWLENNGAGLRKLCGGEMLVCVWAVVAAVCNAALTHQPLEWCFFWWFVLTNLALLGAGLFVGFSD